LCYGVKAVTVKKGIYIVTITPSRLCGSANSFLSNVFVVLNRHKVIVDLVSISEAQVSIALNTQVNGESNLSAAMKDLSEFADAGIRNDRAILSIIGQGMVHRKGVGARMFTVLAEAGVNIEMISQGASEVNISCVVRENQVDGAIEVAHKELCVN